MLSSLPYIENNKIYSADGFAIDKPAIIVFQDNIIHWGSYGFLKFKYEIEKKNLVEKGIPGFNVSLIPLYDVLDISDCLIVLKIAILQELSFNGSKEEYIKFVNKLVRHSDNRKVLKSYIENYKISV